MRKAKGSCIVERWDTEDAAGVWECGERSVMMLSDKIQL